MAVTVAQLANALRVGSTDQETQELTRLGTLAAALVEERAPSAPDTIKDEAVIRIAAFLFDRPNYTETAASLMRSSTAGELLAKWTPIGVRNVDGATAAQLVPSGTGEPGVDAVARAAAEAAQALASANAAKLMPVTNSEADAATATTIRGWTAAAVRRVVEAIVPSWARQPDAPTGGTALPAHEQSDEQGLFSRAGSLFWKAVNEVPDTPGDSTGVGHALTVTGENDRDYAWRAQHDAVARADAASAATVASSNRTSLAALEDVLPDPPIPAAGDEEQSYSLTLPARTAASTRARWEAGGATRNDRVARERIADEITDREAADAAIAARLMQEVTDRTDGDTALGTRIDGEATARTTADTALGARIDALAGYAAPVFDPDYWVKTGDARSILVHLDPRADAITGLAKVRLNIQGINKVVARTANQDVYAFAITATDAGNITRAAGNAGSDTVQADITLLDSGDNKLHEWRGLLRVLDTAPVVGGGGGATRLTGTFADMAAGNSLASFARTGNTDWRNYDIIRFYAFEQKDSTAWRMHESAFEFFVEDIQARPQAEQRSGVFRRTNETSISAQQFSEVAPGDYLAVGHFRGELLIAGAGMLSIRAYGVNL